MIQHHLLALKAVIEAVIPCHVVTVDGATEVTVPKPPYAVVAAVDRRSGEVPVCDDRGVLDTEVRVTVVGITAVQAFAKLDLIADVLSPGLSWTPLTVAGRDAQLQWQRTEFVAADTDVVVIGTDTHPVVGVDSYRLISQPAPVTIP